MMTTIFLFVTLSLLPRLTPGFTLGARSENWGLTTNTLDKYTSHACRIAYEAPIDCSDTLLALVSSPDPAYLPSAWDLDNTCTETCRASLESYVRDVEEVCSSPWDWALVATAARCGDCRFLQTPVSNIGRIFQYKLESACALDRYTISLSSQDLEDEGADDYHISNYDYCYLHPPHEGTNFPCSDACSIDYYKTAHAHPLSDLHFQDLWLVQQSRYWKRDFKEGYQRALVCETPV
jgi:hypothetical protein